MLWFAGPLVCTDCMHGLQRDPANRPEFKVWLVVNPAPLTRSSGDQCEPPMRRLDQTLDARAIKRRATIVVFDAISRLAILHP